MKWQILLGFWVLPTICYQQVIFCQQISVISPLVHSVGKIYNKFCKFCFRQIQLSRLVALSAFCWLAESSGGYQRQKPNRIGAEFYLFSITNLPPHFVDKLLYFQYHNLIQRILHYIFSFFADRIHSRCSVKFSFSDKVDRLDSYAPVPRSPASSRSVFPPSFSFSFPFLLCRYQCGCPLAFAWPDPE